MKDSCFIDTNIWLYEILEPQNEQERNKCLQVKQLLQKWHGKIYLSSQVVNEIANNMHRKYRRYFSDQDIKNTVDYFYHNVKIIETLDIGEEVIAKACTVRDGYPNAFQYWDSIIVAAALLCGARYLFSEDMHHNLVIDKKLTIVNPFAQDQGKL